MFATKWEFLFARVLIGIDRSTGVWSGSEPTPGQQMVCVWTSEQNATEALHVESWELRWIDVRDLVGALPPGIGVVVDPERPDGMTASAAYVANLRELAEPFPANVPVRIAGWEELDGPALKAVVDVAERSSVLEQIHAFMYIVDDSPAIGCLAYTLKGGVQDADRLDDDLAAAIEESAPDVTELHVAAVTIMALSDVPIEVRTALPDSLIIHGHKRFRRRRLRLR